MEKFLFLTSSFYDLPKRMVLSILVTIGRLLLFAIEGISYVNVCSMSTNMEYIRCCLV